MKYLKYTLILVFTVALNILFFSPTVMAEEKIINGEKIEFLEENMRVMATKQKYIFASGDVPESPKQKGLYRSEDEGKTWKILTVFNKNIDGMFVAGDLLFVSVSKDKNAIDSKNSIFVSKNNGDSFIELYNTEAGSPSSTSFDYDGENVYFSEYGNKKENNARNIYRYNIDSNKVEKIYSPKPILGYHNHVLRVDKNNKNVIYQTIGDDIKKIIKSEDAGKTWKTIINGIHPISMIQAGDEFIYGLDDFPISAIVKVDEKKKKFKIVYKTEEDFSGPIYDLKEKNGIIYALQISYDDKKSNGSVLISKDNGITWERKFEFLRKEDNGVGLYKINFTEKYGYIWCTLPFEKDGAVDIYRGTLKFQI